MNQALGEERRAFWKTEGITTILKRYDIAAQQPSLTLFTDLLLEEIMEIQPSEIIQRLQFWFGRRYQQHGYFEMSVSEFVQQMMEPVVVPIPYLQLQEGRNWFDLISTPLDDRTRYLPMEMEFVFPKRTAIRCFESAIGKST